MRLITQHHLRCLAPCRNYCAQLTTKKFPHRLGFPRHVALNAHAWHEGPGICLESSEISRRRDRLIAQLLVGEPHS
ncbi:protein of unknown function [Paraburkholderia dioscoreae]|uniref:Uncharacterized protein n=1 Tax=Paraburkholderia dioscoreae TaxID=2604047 RepID=A0A5Q4YTB1_9BURK|nr:protein of unknown function [Paraburkholderia dioscoreae]